MRWVRFAIFLSAAVVYGQSQPQPGQLPPSVSPIATQGPYIPITGQERAKWFAGATVGPQSLAAGIWSAGWGTAFNDPEEYGGTWEGFGKRYGMRMTGVATGNAMEAGLGAIWGEDPRYIRSGGSPFGARMKNVLKMTFFAYRPDGSVRPAYARMAGTFGNNFLSWMWRVESEKGASDALIRSGWGLLGRMGAHAFAEFWPDIREQFFR